MNTEQHPALITERDELPSPTLVLPGDLGKDQALTGLVQAIGQVRTDLAARVRLFQRRVQEFAASGDQLGQALCRGQVLAGEHAAATIDEGIVVAFNLWDQYEREIRQAAQIAGSGERMPSNPGGQSA